MSKDITVVWRRYQDIEVGDVVGPPDYDDATGWAVVEAVELVDTKMGLGNTSLSKVPQHIRLAIPYRDLGISGFPLGLIQVQVENFS